jgi:hypothetical protein
MERPRFVADRISVTQAEDADNRTARRMLVGEKMASMDAEVYPLIAGAFAGPETIPDELCAPACSNGSTLPDRPQATPPDRLEASRRRSPATARNTPERRPPTRSTPPTPTRGAALRSRCQ